jgi:hypothetical protein
VPFTAGLHLEHWDKVDTSGAMDDGCRAGCISPLTRYTHFNSAPRHRARGARNACACTKRTGVNQRVYSSVSSSAGASRARHFCAESIPARSFLSRRTPPPACQRIMRYECIMLSTQICIQQICPSSYFSTLPAQGFYTLTAQHRAICRDVLSVNKDVYYFIRGGINFNYL